MACAPTSPAPSGALPDGRSPRGLRRAACDSAADPAAAGVDGHDAGEQYRADREYIRSSHFQAQRFETGDNTGEYTITEVQIRLSTVTSGDTTSVKIKGNNSGAPGNLVATLMNPATLTGSALNTFTATRAVADLLASNYLDNGLSINLSLIGDTDTNTNQVSAHKFTTGFAAGGYTLDSVSFHAGSFLGTNISPQISIYSSGADGSPDSSLVVLTGTVETAGEHTLTAPANTTLDASTSYFVVFEDTNIDTPVGNFGVWQAEDADENGASLPGWSINNRHFKMPHSPIQAGLWTQGIS